MSKLLFVGEACNLPSGEAFAGRSGARLAVLLGLSLEQFLATCDRVNLLDGWPGRSGGAKGHLFDVGRARTAAGRLRLTERHVVLCGLRVASAFGLRRAVFLRPVELGRDEASCVVLPHPSGIVRWYNSGANVRAASRTLRGMARRCAASSERS
jgi:hypothetical protein